MKGILANISLNMTKLCFGVLLMCSLGLTRLQIKRKLTLVPHKHTWNTFAKYCSSNTFTNGSLVNIDGNDVYWTIRKYGGGVWHSKWNTNNKLWIGLFMNEDEAFQWHVSCEVYNPNILADDLNIADTNNIDHNKKCVFANGAGEWEQLECCKDDKYGICEERYDESCTYDTLDFQDTLLPFKNEYEWVEFNDSEVNVDKCKKLCNEQHECWVAIFEIDPRKCLLNDLESNSWSYDNDNPYVFDNWWQWEYGNTHVNITSNEASALDQNLILIRRCFKDPGLIDRNIPRKYRIGNRNDPGYSDCELVNTIIPTTSTYIDLFTKTQTLFTSDPPQTSTSQSEDNRQSTALTTYALNYVTSEVTQAQTSVLGTTTSEVLQSASSMSTETSSPPLQTTTNYVTSGAFSTTVTAPSSLHTTTSRVTPKTFSTTETASSLLQTTTNSELSGIFSTTKKVSSPLQTTTHSERLGIFSATETSYSSLHTTTNSVTSDKLSTTVTTAIDSTSQSISTEVIWVTTTPEGATDPRMCLCECGRSPKYRERKEWIKNLNMTRALKEMRNELLISKTRLSSHRRKLISSFDGRKESTGIGVTLGVGILCVVTGWVTVPDVYTLIRYLLKDRRIHVMEA